MTKTTWQPLANSVPAVSAVSAESAVSAVSAVKLAVETAVKMVMVIEHCGQTQVSAVPAMTSVTFVWLVAALVLLPAPLATVLALP